MRIEISLNWIDEPIQPTITDLHLSDVFNEFFLFQDHAKVKQKTVERFVLSCKLLFSSELRHQTRQGRERERER